MSLTKKYGKLISWDINGLSSTAYLRYQTSGPDGLYGYMYLNFEGGRIRVAYRKSKAFHKGMTLGKALNIAGYSIKEYKEELESKYPQIGKVML